MKASLTRQGIASKYTFDPPVALRAPKILNTFTGIKTAFSDPTRFRVIYEKYGYGSFLMFDDIAKCVDISSVLVPGILIPNLDTIPTKQWYLCRSCFAVHSN